MANVYQILQHAMRYQTHDMTYLTKSPQLLYKKGIFVPPSLK